MSNGRSIGRGAARESVPDTVLYDAALLNRLWLYLRPYADYAGASLALRRVAVKDPTRSRGIDLPAGALTGDAADVLDDP